MTFTSSMEHMREVLATRDKEIQNLRSQITRLADYILSLDCGFPMADDEYPEGMSATEAAEAYIRKLRGQLVRHP